MNQKDLKKLKDALPWGAQADVANTFHVSASLVSQILSGKTPNDEILKALIKKAVEYQKKQDKIRKEMEAL